MNSKGFFGFIKAHYKFAGYDTLDEYLKMCNPMINFKDIKVPLLLLNAEDDLICPGHKIPID